MWPKRKQIDIMMGLYLYPYEDSLLPVLTKLMNSPKFLPMNEVTETVVLAEGSYVIMCCLFT